MRRRFHTLDVFTRRAFAGNPLAVVLDAEGLDDAAMQRIASEFNLSETVFVGPPKDPLNTAAIRIFFPTGELPFAGHPTVGTAVLLARLQAPQAMRAAGGVVIALEERIGLVKVEVSQQGDAARAVFEVPKLSERQPAHYDVSRIAAALGLAPAEIGLPGHEVSLWSAGVPYVMVPIASLAAIGRIGIADDRLWRDVFGKGGVYLYTSETVSADHHIHARMFWPDAGIREDPATGSAVAAFAGLAAAFEQPEDGTHQLVIEQGYEMGRPSEIALDIDVVGGALTGARIGGSAVLMSEGALIEA